MKQLPVPVHKVLSSETDDVAVARVLSKARALHQARRRQRAIVATTAIAAAGLLFFRFSRTTSTVGPLLREDGSLPSAINTSTPTQVHFRDQSVLSMHTGRLLVRENNAHTFATELLHGTVHLSITPGGPRRWSVRCDGVLVEVTGTVFDVEQGERFVRVAVERGSVRVSGPRVQNTRTLRAGESLRISWETPVQTPPIAIATPRNEEATNIEPPTVRTRTQAQAPRVQRSNTTVVAWRQLAAQGQYEQAYAELGNGGVARVEQSSSAEDLLALSDVARLSGHPAEAVSPLERLLREHASDPHAPLAAIALGRVQLDSLGHPSLAANAFTRALALGVPRSLEEDVRVRLVEAHARAGAMEQARTEAEAYLRRFPEGRRAATVRRWVPSP